MSHPRITRTRGRHSVTDRMREAVTLQASGWTVRAIARYYDVTESSVEKWLSRVREALEDGRRAD